MSPWWWLLWVACRPSGEVGPSTPSAGDTVVSSSPGATADSGPVRDTGPWADPWACGAEVQETDGIEVSLTVKTYDDGVGIYVGVATSEVAEVVERVPLSEPGYTDCWYETYVGGSSSTRTYGGAAEVTVGERTFTLDYREATSLSPEQYAYHIQQADHPDFDWADWLDQAVTFRLEGSGEVPPIETMWVGRTALAAVEVDAPGDRVDVDPETLVYCWPAGASPTGRVTIRWQRSDVGPTDVVCDVVDSGSWSPPPSELALLEPSQGMSFALWTAPVCARSVAPGARLVTAVRHSTGRKVYADPASVP